MRHNRIAASFQPAADPWTVATTPAPVATCERSASSMVALPNMTQAIWQTQLLRLAYQRALADLAPPAHHRRFFCVWN